MISVFIQIAQAGDLVGVAGHGGNDVALLQDLLLAVDDVDSAAGDDVMLSISCSCVCLPMVTPGASVWRT